MVRYSPITDGQLSRSPPRMLPVDPAGVDPLPKMPGMGVKDGSTSPQGAGVTGTVIYPGRPSPGWGGDNGFAPTDPVYQHGCP